MEILSSKLLILIACFILSIILVINLSVIDVYVDPWPTNHIEPSHFLSTDNFQAFFSLERLAVISGFIESIDYMMGCIKR